MSEELKPCPFCGGGETYKSEWVGIRGKPNALVCKKCGAHGPYGNGEDGATATWNRRTSEPMTSIIKWPRYDGTPGTLPDDGRVVLIPSPQEGDVVMVRFQRYSDVPKWCGLVWRAQAICKPGDIWAYLPEPPEGAKWHSAETEQ